MERLWIANIAPGTSDVRVAVQLPVPPAVVHGLPLSVPGPDAIEKLICVPSGAGTKPPPLPRFTSTWPVKVWVAPTGFVPFGVIEMRASTNVFTASPEFPFWPSVATVSGKPPTWSVAVA